MPRLQLTHVSHWAEAQGKGQGGAAVDPDLIATVADMGNAVTNGTNLQTAITSATFGSTIVLQAGAEYRGNFTLPDRGSGTSPITIRSTVGLPIGRRVSPGQTSSMAKLTTATANPIFTMLADSHHWTLSGLEFTTTADPYATGVTNTSFANVNQDGSVTYGRWPHHMTFDRCVMHPYETDPSCFRASTRALALDGANMTVSNCYIYDFMGWGTPATVATVTAATNASPCQITTSAASGDPGRKELVSFSGGTGAWAVLNGTKVGTWVDSTHWTLEDYDPVTFALSNVTTTSAGSFSGQTVIRLSQDLTQSTCVLLQMGPGPVTITNNFLQSQYSQLFSGGSTYTWIDPAHEVTVTAVTDLTHVTLSGVTDLQVGDMIAFKQVDDQTVSAAATRPGVPTQTLLTVQTHGFPAGTTLYRQGYIAVSGFTGAWAILNGNHSYATIVDSTHLAIMVDTSALTPGATGSGMKWVPFVTPGAPTDTFTRWHVGHVTNISGLNITYEWWGHQPANLDGNGAGLLVTTGSAAQYRGRLLDGITITKNTISKKASWTHLFRDIAGTSPGVASGQKAYWESKQGLNVLVEGNIFDVTHGSLGPTELGTVAIGLNQANQVGATPWITNSNWIIRNNIFYNLSYHKFQMVEEFMTGTDGSGLVISNNLFTPAPSSWIELGGLNGVTVTHNTVRNLGTGNGEYHGYIAIVGHALDVTIRDNIGLHATYGYMDIFAGSPGGTPFVPTALDHEYLIDNLAVGFTPPAGVTRLATDAAMGFVNVSAADARGDYHGYALTAGSPGYHAASEGGTVNVGVDFAALDAALTGNDGWTGA